MQESKQKFLILDGNALIHRAFHALPSTMITKEGIPTNATYGFISAFLKVLNDINPEYIAVCFDVKKETFRNEIYKEYKANRIKQPDELYTQFSYIKEAINYLNIKMFEKEGFEADDVIGTICKKFDNSNIETIILTGDKDTLQLVDKDTKVYTFKTGISEILVYDELMVKEKIGVTPNQIIDYKALRGDPSDNIPGVKGIGEKTAVDLLTKYNNLENLYKNIEIENEKIDGITERILNLLKTQKELAFLSYKLSTIDRNVDIDFNLEDCKKKEFDFEKIKELFIKLEFKTLLERILKTDKNNININNKAENNNNTEKINKNLNKNIILKNEKEIDLFLNKLEKEKEFIFDIDGNAINKINNISGISFCLSNLEAYYINYEYIKNNIELYNKIKNIFENNNIKKISHDIKNNAHILKNININLKGIFFDTMIAAYIIYPGDRNYSIDKLAFSEFGELTNKAENNSNTTKKTQSTMDFIDPIKNTKDFLENTNYIFRLYKKYFEEINKDEKTKYLFFNIEMAIVEILFNMEENGVLLDINYLKELSFFYEEKIKNIENFIFNITGEFNLNSPKQLQEILFTKLNLDIKGIKKIKTGISTASDELEKLRDSLIEISEELVEEESIDEKKSVNIEIIEILNKIIEYREYQKLKTTYIDSLPRLVDVNKKIHTTFNQVITATGRLSSSDPNLQNIPIRTEDGNKIRKSFISRDGYKLVGIDYSQIELRVIASLANEKTMIDSFKNNLDIHKVTASIVNNIKLEDVTKEQRRAAKAVNFGVIYGMGPRKLSRETGLSFKESKEYIKKYFEINKNISIYIDSLINFARENEYVENIIGRKRYLKDINSYQDQIKNQSERMAQNMPIQGLAADIMKLAMKKVYDKINQKFGENNDIVKILLQVHDELVFEIKENEFDFIKDIIYEMENAFILPNGVNLKVEVELGKNWGEMEDYNI